LKLLSSSTTDKKAIFSVSVVGNLLFAGCAGKSLIIYEIERFRLKKVKELKTTEVIYSFLDLSPNFLICGEREGNIEVFNLNNLEEQSQIFHFGVCGHITQI